LRCVAALGIALHHHLAVEYRARAAVHYALVQLAAARTAR
jgi:hypothetical protein